MGHFGADIGVAFQLKQQPGRLPTNEVAGPELKIGLTGNQRDPEIEKNYSLVKKVLSLEPKMTIDNVGSFLSSHADKPATITYNGRQLEAKVMVVVQDGLQADRGFLSSIALGVNGQGQLIASITVDKQVAKDPARFAARVAHETLHLMNNQINPTPADESKVVSQTKAKLFQIGSGLATLGNASEKELGKKILATPEVK